ncbi:hypothetical protein PIB30_075459 [Stylosanthes scabra]|uniref:Uncharacterized protein n=1 Tax=Stylosanthes scabra TaxID=79078 RepID=A0ABU6SQW0_9FABA|nr:hypothetical protein [Stylosanthes scabra]
MASKGKAPAKASSTGVRGKRVDHERFGGVTLHTWCAEDRAHFKCGVVGLRKFHKQFGCTSTSKSCPHKKKAAHAALKLRKQLTSNTKAAHATHRSCARSFLAPAKLLAQQIMVHTHLPEGRKSLNLKARSGISSLWT